jgi:Raf kinase inhibitor-like YbhB/YbcL family protein
MPAAASTFETVSVRATDRPKSDTQLSVTSSSFADGQTIGMDFVFTGCGGKNRSPQLAWSGAPSGTKSFAITCFDPDAPTGSGYWHWSAFDIPPSVASVSAGAGTNGSPAGGKSGSTDFGISSYCGPCPPKGDHPHRYIFTVYALDVESLGADDSTTGATTIFKMRGHVLAKGSLTGVFGH